MTTHKNTYRKTYPLSNCSDRLYFTTVPGSEVLGIHLIRGDEEISIPVGNYSVAQSLWLTRNRALHLPLPLLDEILTIAKGVAYARRSEYSRLSRLTS